MEQEDNLTNANMTVCSVFETMPYTIVALISASTASISLMACAVSLFLSIALKKYIFFVQRLIMYLAIVAMVNSFSIVLRFQELKDIYLPGNNDTNLNNLCMFTAFLDQTSAWAETLAVACITFNLFLTAVFKKETEKLEIVYIIVIFIFPITFNWIPFVGGAYGEAGAWCWMRNLDENCNFLVFGEYVRFILWYVPNYIILVTVVLSYLFIVFWIIRTRKKWGLKYDPETERQKVKMVKEIWPLLLYPLGYLLLNIFPLINRIQGSVDPDNPVYPLWILHAIFSPLQGGYIAILYALDKDTRKRINCSRIKAALCCKEAKVEEYAVTIDESITDSLPASKYDQWNKTQEKSEEKMDD